MSTGYRVPATGNALGITTDSPGTTKDCAESTCTEDLLHARYFDLQYGDIFNPSDSPERLLTVDMRKYLQDQVKATQLAGGRTRIPASAGRQKPTSHSSIPSCRPWVPFNL